MDRSRQAQILRSSGGCRATPDNQGFSMTSHARLGHTGNRAETPRVLLALFATLTFACGASQPESAGSGPSAPKVASLGGEAADSGIDGTEAESGGDAEGIGLDAESAIAVQAALAAPSLGAAASFGVLAGSTVNNTGATSILEGDLGVAPGLTLTGFPPGLMQGGRMYAGDSNASQAQSDVTAAYGLLAGDPCTRDLTGRDVGGLTLAQGVYCFSSEAQLTGTLVLDAQGDPSAVFVFQVGSNLTTAGNASVVFIHGGQSCRAFWQIGGSATLGANTVFAGSLLAITDITLDTGASVSGRVLARNGAVTMDSNQIFDVRAAHDGSCVGPGSDVGAETSGP